MMKTHLAPWCLALLLPLSACSVTMQPAPAPAESAAATPVVQAPSAETSSTAPTGSTWTHQLVVNASRPASSTSAQILGEQRDYPQSMSLWVGCEGRTDTVTLRTEGRYRRLEGMLGFRSHVARGLVAHVLISVDGKPVSNTQLDSDDQSGGVPIQLVITGAQEVTFASTMQQGQCSPSSESYAVLGDGRVE